MTWQRIDDDTYIDDTLVTCMEYQLFIDEMREQGKYYQPDHWSSCQFPIGRPAEPILGVRHSDALAFCEWLSIREQGEWKYSLPTQNNEAQYPIKIFDKALLGYWMIGNSSKHEFAWLGSGVYVKLKASFTKDFPVFKSGLEDVRRIFDALEKDLNYRPNHGEAHTLDLMNDYYNGTRGINQKQVSRDRVLAVSRAREFDIARAIINILKSKSGDDPRLIRSLTSALEIVNDRDHFQDKTSSLRMLIPKGIRVTKDLRTSIIDLYVDILTLQERIAGRSPAFEGIRLVKERIR